MQNVAVIEKISALYAELFKHDGYGELRVEMRILRRGQKEIIIHCGKQYRFVVDFMNDEKVLIENELTNAKIENFGSYVGPDRRAIK